MYLLIASLIMMSLASCTSNENDPAEEISSAYTLISTYGARSVSEEGGDGNSDKLNLNNLPAISVAEANSILAGIRKHDAARKEGNVYEAQSNGTTYLKVAMSETISNKYTFSIQLNMKKVDGALYYSSYETSSSDIFKWYFKGFSFSSDNSNKGNYKFTAETFLYLKIIDNGIKYLQVPVSVKGTYNPSTQEADFTYNL